MEGCADQRYSGSASTADAGDFLGQYDRDSLRGSGRRDNAFQWLNVAYKEPDLGMERLKTDPLLDPLRQDPRLAELIKRIGLP